jgi:hypothetical protein
MHTTSIYLERAHEGFVHTHHSAGIIKFAAIIRSAEQRDELPPSKEFVAVFNDLVRSANEIQVVAAKELSNDVLAKRERNTAIVLPPPNYVFVWVRPQ